jgi:drug/metabolite transporter (DMT)-like permease
MTFIFSFLAAIISALIFYFKDNKNKFKTLFLTLMYFAASLMWFIDIIFEYAKSEDHTEIFNPSVQTLISESLLGIVVVLAGAFVWLIYLLISDPLHKFRKEINN